MDRLQTVDVADAQIGMILEEKTRDLVFNSIHEIRSVCQERPSGEEAFFLPRLARR